MMACLLPDGGSQDLLDDESDLGLKLEPAC